MASIRHDDELGPGPGPGEGPGALEGADHVVAALDDGAGKGRECGCVAQQLALVHPALVQEVVALDAGEGQGGRLVAVRGDEVGVGNELAGGALPDAPGLGGGQVQGRVVAQQPGGVGLEEVTALGLGDGVAVGLPGIGEGRYYLWVL